MKKLLNIVLLSVALGIPGAAFAGPEATVVATPIFGDYGNNSLEIDVVHSTQAFVLISSVATNAGVGTATWRHRQVINYTDGNLLVSDKEDDFDVYYSTKGVLILPGKAYTIPHQGELWGISAPGTTVDTTGGIGGEQTYWK